MLKLYFYISFIGRKKYKFYLSNYVILIDPTRINLHNLKVSCVYVC